ncbi:PLP-dependent aminotransferase family protein [Prauserella muralis]|uniref:GntR family transcriptional regulator n=1 Tax=Prauserella muralis TaxID=588067 RepID=A0A2V4ARY3_9PSEU|nr:PLP-dependent aminotransferase family protein [Prauserella muralis]PXY22784.1 GntR family transcriptional regulator [Prauserella muralis]TWE28526.1 GntR family transcriptional regulator/MocR family aminotransferase [Prauserella muralis]
MPESWTNSGAAERMHIELRRAGATSLHRQLAEAIRQSIRSGRLPLGASLPPTRTIAADLGVSRGVVVEAYQQLVAEGYLTSRPGGYTRVAAGAEAPTAPAVPRPPPAPPRNRIDFGYGRADVSSFPRAAWLRSVRRVLNETPADRLGYLDGRGAPELHRALADYLNRVRGTAARPENVLVTNGFAQAGALLVQTLAAAGASRIAVEDPSADDDVRPAARAAGLDVVGVAVGGHGVRVELLEGLRADALVLTPSHQWPTGGVLPAESRLRVLRWARRTGAIVVEDDYDAEYRYDRQPVGAMQGLDPDHVVYAGTASKTLAPGLRLGWLVLPPGLVPAVTGAKIAADRGSPVLDQLTFADFLVHGEFDRHLRRMRPVYRRRRDALLNALRTYTPDLEPAGVSAGLHLVTWLPPDVDETALVRAAAQRGLGVHGVSPYRLGDGGRGGLIFGYATLGEAAITRGVAELAGVLGRVRRGAPPGGG